jgi:hypothetical protein
MKKIHTSIINLPYKINKTKYQIIVIHILPLNLNYPTHYFIYANSYNYYINSLNTKGKE